MDLVAWAAWALGGWHGHVINCVDRATGDMFLGGHGIVAVGLFSGALVSYARRGFAGWGINCVDRATGDWRLPGGVGSAQLVYFGVVGIVRAVRIRWGGVGLIPWIGRLGIVTILEGVGSAQLVYFGGVGIVCAAWIRWGGVGLIAYRSAGESAHVQGARD